jgi:hypothetical protein
MDLMTYSLMWQELEFIRGKYKVVWEYIGEGNDGDYDPTDVTDEPLLRFSCFKRADELAQWEEIPCSSYCTRCPVSTPKAILKLFARSILDACEQPSPKRRLEELSWLCEDDAKKPGLEYELRTCYENEKHNDGKNTGARMA